MRLAKAILASGLVAALLGDFLFHDSPLGLNLALWLGLLLAAGAGFYHLAGGRDRRLFWLAAVPGFFAWCLAWRASPFLRFWNLAAILAGGVMVATALRSSLGEARLPDYLKGALHLATRIGLGAVEAAGVLLSGGGESDLTRRARKIGIGLILAVPVLVVFGSLLAEADPLFERFLDGLAAWRPSELWDHALLLVVSGWVALGWLRLMVAPPPRAEGGRCEPPLRLGPLEVGIPLGVLVTLLAAFLGLQARYLFGGEEIVRSTGLTYAEFARRGFFELVAVATLVVPLLYGAQWLLDRGARGAVASFRALVSVLGGLVALVMVSALSRMRLYVGAYGLTEDRLYAAVFMIWIGAVLGWLVLTELRGQQRRFLTGALAAGFAVLAVLNLVNPDGLIARVNIERALSGRTLDAKYLARLSVDAVPTVLARWSNLDPDAQCALRSSLITRAAPVKDWRAWTVSAARAAGAARQMRPLERC
jgi:hypothetical protein